MIFHTSVSRRPLTVSPQQHCIRRPYAEKTTPAWKNKNQTPDIICSSDGQNGTQTRDEKKLNGLHNPFANMRAYPSTPHIRSSRSSRVTNGRPLWADLRSQVRSPKLSQISDALAGSRSPGQIYDARSNLRRPARSTTPGRISDVFGQISTALVIPPTPGKISDARSDLRRPFTSPTRPVRSTTPGPAPRPRVPHPASTTPPLPQP